MDLHDLETKGYVVIPNFLDAAEVKLLQEDYDYRLFSPNKNYPIKHSSNSERIGFVFDKVRNQLDQINTTTNLHVDRHVPRGIYTDTSLKKYSFHLDHESYYIFQDHYNYLLFFMPCIKPVKNESGLSVIPFDRLKEVLPERADSFKGVGAIDFSVKDNNTTIRNNTTGEVYTIPFDIRTIADTPDLAEGDLLIMRGDIIHGTQVSESTRVALTIRCFNSKSHITKENLNVTCPFKDETMRNNPMPYDKIASLFEKYGREYITIGEYLDN